MDPELVAFLLRRAGQSLLTVAAVLVAVFFLSRVTGDPTNLYLPPTADEVSRAAFRARHGLDQPVITQFWVFVKTLAGGDLGTSIWRSRPAAEIVSARLGSTFLLGFLVLAFSLPLAMALGITAGLKPRGVAAYIVRVASSVAASTPDFWVGLMLLWLFAFSLDWLPSIGGGGLKAAILPVLTLSLYPVGVLSQVIRASVERERYKAHVRAARSRGLGPARIARRYIVRTAMTPVVALLGAIAVGLLNGVVIVEAIFGWPGIGGLTIEAVNNRDFPLLQAIVIIVAFITVGVNIFIDAILALLDPRIRHPA